MLFGNQGKPFFQHTLRPAIPVMHRVLQQIPFLVQQPEVHAPCIHADAVHLPIRLRLNQPLLYLMEKAKDIPIHRTVYNDRVI